VKFEKERKKGWPPPKRNSTQKYHNLGEGVETVQDWKKEEGSLSIQDKKKGKETPSNFEYFLDSGTERD